ncbi:hypothetical protein Tco_1330712 [Tanacetum coccineum]
MASGGSGRDAEDALSKLLQIEKEHIIKKKADTILSLQSELVLPGIKGSLKADEDIGFDEVSSAIGGVFDIGESNVEIMEVHSNLVMRINC